LCSTVKEGMVSYAAIEGEKEKGRRRSRGQDLSRKEGKKKRPRLRCTPASRFHQSFYGSNGKRGDVDSGQAFLGGEWAEGGQIIPIHQSRGREEEKKERERDQKRNLTHDKIWRKRKRVLTLSNFFFPSSYCCSRRARKEEVSGKP